MMNGHQSMSEPPPPRSAFSRTLWKFAGTVSLAIGLIGIVVPLLPTTPFLLLAAYCYQRGSEELHQWLLQHPRFGPLVRDWRERGAIPPRAKRNAVIALAIVWGISWLIGVAPFVLAIQAAVLAVVAAFILSRPD